MLRMAWRMALFPFTMGLRALENRLAPPVLVLLYHRVTALESDPQLLCVHPDNFRAQMRYLKENFSVARLEEDWSRIPKPAVVVTFDDGYADNALEALPILAELGVPATFFVSTGLIGTRREFWWDEVERVVLGEGTFPPRFALRQGEGERVWPTVTAKDRQRMYREILPVLKEYLPEHRDAALAALRAWGGASLEGRSTHRVLSEEELRLLAASPLATIGAHTESHSPLAALPPARQAEEIGGSKEWLERFLGRKVEVFSYPFGSRWNDYTEETAALCRELRFSRAASNFPGQWRADSDPYQLPRQIVRDWDLATFQRELRRFWIT